MKLFSKKKKNNGEEMAQRIAHHAIRYVSENINDVENVIGRAGELNLRDGELLVFSSGDVIMRCAVNDLQAWELMSGDGVVLTAPDLEHGGTLRTVTVHYTYYNK